VQIFSSKYGKEKYTMKSRVVFFDTLRNSKSGTLRFFVILPFFAAVYIGWNWIIPWSPLQKIGEEISTGRKVLVFFLFALFVIPAFATHNPNTLKKASVYAGLVGLVVHSVVTCALLLANPDWKVEHALADILFGVVAISLLGSILYGIVEKNNKILGVV
jgi:hypothetical protein